MIALLCGGGFGTQKCGGEIAGRVLIKSTQCRDGVTGRIGLHRDGFSLTPPPPGPIPYYTSCAEISEMNFDFC